MQGQIALTCAATVQGQRVLMITATKDGEHWPLLSPGAGQWQATGHDLLSNFSIAVRGDTEKSILTRMLADVLQPLVKPLIKSMFVGK